ncbi:hypothetical protein B0H13DRAFT_1922597 [Mycena leptocephala]|nr:hypothetical protein B0H13DRAFT_1922597 [Mycena leptocephala]
MYLRLELPRNLVNMLVFNVTVCPAAQQMSREMIEALLSFIHDTGKAGSESDLSLHRDLLPRHVQFQAGSEVMLKTALVLASVSYALATMTAIPTNDTAYIMQDGRTTRCVTLGAAPTSNYAKIVESGLTNADGIHFAFSSVASPLTYLSYVSAEIANSGGQASLYQQSMGHPEPLEFLLQPAPTANMSILYFSNGPGGVLTANTPFSAASPDQPSPFHLQPFGTVAMVGIYAGGHYCQLNLSILDPRRQGPDRPRADLAKARLMGPGSAREPSNAVNMSLSVSE